MICDRCKKEIIGIHLFKRRVRRDLVLCQSCREQELIKKLNKKKGRIRILGSKLLNIKKLV